MNLKASDISTTNITDINQSSSALVDNLATNLNDLFYQCASDANMKVKCASGRCNKPKISKHKNGLLLAFHQWKLSYLVWLKNYAPLHTIP